MNVRKENLGNYVITSYMRVEDLNKGKNVSNGQPIISISYPDTKEYHEMVLVYGIIYIYDYKDDEIIDEYNTLLSIEDFETDIDILEFLFCVA